MRGFEPAAALVGSRLQRAAERRGFAVARLLTHWAEIVGADLAAVTRPVRIAHGRGGFGATLTVLSHGPMAPMVAMQAETLRARVNACHGWNAVQRVTVTQTAAAGFAEAQSAFSGVPAAPPRASDPAAAAGAAAVADRFADPALAAAMAQLALNLAARRSAGRPASGP